MIIYNNLIIDEIVQGLLILGGVHWAKETHLEDKVIELKQQLEVDQYLIGSVNFWESDINSQDSVSGDQLAMLHVFHHYDITMCAESKFRMFFIKVT